MVVAVVVVVVLAAADAEGNVTAVEADVAVVEEFWKGNGTAKTVHENERNAAKAEREQPGFMVIQRGNAKPCTDCRK